MSQDGQSRRYMTARQVRERFGGISDMSLWRWVHDPKVGFPQPITISRRRLFDEQEVDEFERRRREEREGVAA